jgi:hypothetical protein
MHAEHATIAREVQRAFLLCAAAVLVTTSQAHALDKQGSAHGGAVAGEDDGFDIEGALLYGVSLYNASYAARPANTGLTLFRYALHADIDLVGRRLSIPLDVNMFTDRMRSGLRKLVPSEGDVIAGVTSTWAVGPGALELGTRVEHDRTLDATTEELRISPDSQTYVDMRARWLYSAAAVWSKLGEALGDGDVSGWLTLGWFTFNPTYAARPDNTGSALFRYAVHSELSIIQDHISFGLDATMFTDRRNANFFGPTELDFTPEVIVRAPPIEVHVAYERDMPLDRGGLVQHFVYLLAGYEFDLAHIQPGPLETRGHIVSP